MWSAQLLERGRFREICSIMASAADMGHGQPSLADLSRTIRGWNNPRPISVRLRSGFVAALREDLRRNITTLTRRCEDLDGSLSDSLLRHRAYVGSKVHRHFPLDVGPALVGGRSAIPTISDPLPRIRHAPVKEASQALFNSLPGGRATLVVGGVADSELLKLLEGQNAAWVTPGDGKARTTYSGSQRPAAESFSTWMAEHEESQRAALGTIVLSRAAGRADVNLLRHRLYGHQTVLVESGSAALTWLLAEWDGGVVRHANLFAFTEPGEVFHEPSTRTRMSSDAHWPRVTVVTISYNQCDYLEQCLNSVLDQAYPNLDYIVIDANSSDGSIDILRRYEARFTHLVIEPDEGQSDGLTKGFNLATGDILTWVNSDDMLAPLALKRAAMAFGKSGADLVAGTCSRVAGVDGELLYRHYSALPTEQRVPFDLSGPLNWCGAWEKGDYFFQPEVFFSRNIWERAGGYLKPHLYWAMDWDLWLRCALAGATVFRIPDVLGVSRVHEAQKTKSDEMYLWQVTNILREYDDLLACLERHSVMA
jgi:GT2 family glycosyltransferase